MSSATTWTVRRADPVAVRRWSGGPLERAYVWSVALTGAVVSSEAAIPLSPSDRTLFAASSAPLLAVLVTGAARAATGRLRRWVPAMVLPWVALLAVAAASISWTVAPGATVDAAPVLAVLAALLVTVAVVEPPPGLRSLLERAVVLGGAAGAAWGVLGALAGTLPTSGGGAPRFSAIDAPNATAAAMLLPLVLATHRALRRRGGDPGTPGTRWWPDAAAAVVMLCGIVLTGSRGGLLAALAGVLVLVVLAGTSMRRGVVLALIGCLALLFVAVPPELQARLTATHSTGRTGLWELALVACEEHCVFGGGYGTFPTIYTETFRSAPSASGYHVADFKAHNIWLEVAVELGLLGVTVLAVGVAATVATAWRGPPGVRVPAVAAVAAVLVATMFLSHLPFRYFWLVLVYVVLAGGEPAPRRPAAS